MAGHEVLGVAKGYEGVVDHEPEAQAMDHHEGQGQTGTSPPEEAGRNRGFRFAHAGSPGWLVVCSICTPRLASSSSMIWPGITSS